MSEITIEKGKSGENWRITLGHDVEYFDHEPTQGELTQFRQSIAARGVRKRAEALMRVSERPGRVDGGFEASQLQARR